MNAKKYYDAHATRHTQEGEVSRVLQTGKIPANPSQVDWAVYWMMKMNLSKPAKCLDVGCAVLTLLRSVDSLCQERVGVDISRLPNWQQYPDISTSVHDLDQGPLPFPDGTFDAVSMLAVLEHVFDPFHAVHELRRVCKPNGKVIIGVPNIAGIRHRLRLMWGKLPVTSTWQSFEEGAWDGYHLHNFTRQSLSWLFQKEGLRPLSWACQGRAQFLKKLSPSLFGNDLSVLCEISQPDPSAKLAF